MTEQRCCRISSFGKNLMARVIRPSLVTLRVLAGDAIKSVKPYFGLGVNTAFEDCIELDRCVMPDENFDRYMSMKMLAGVARGWGWGGVSSSNIEKWSKIKPARLTPTTVHSSQPTIRGGDVLQRY